MNLPKLNLLLMFTFYIISQVSIFNFHLTLLVCQISALNVIWIRVQRHTNVSKQATFLDGFDVSPLKWRVCGYGLNRFVHEGLNHISNVKVHIKTRSVNVNIHP